MGIAAVKLKVMPTGVDTDLEALEVKIKELANTQEAKNVSITQEPIAFGLKALIVFFGWNEDKDLEEFQNKISELEGAANVDVIDMRRAFG